MENYTTFDHYKENIKALSPEELDEIELQSEIIKNIVEARQNKGITQEELAQICGFKQPAIARLEKMKVDPQMSTIIKILKPLGLKIAIVPNQNDNMLNKV